MEAEHAAVSTKVCPRCRVQSRTAAERCPSCGRRYERPRWLKIAAILAAAAALGAATSLTLAALDDDEGAETPAIPSIAFAQGARVKIGTSRAEVLRLFGQPAAVRQRVGRRRDLSCVYYAISDQPGLWQFCFRSARLAVSSTRTRLP